MPLSQLEHIHKISLKMNKQATRLTNKWAAERLPVRPKDANKGTFGKVLVVAGSENYPGAAYLSCAAAYRVGAGLVTLVTEKEVKIIVSRKLPEVTFLSQSEVLNRLGDYNVLLIGPGLGQSKETHKFVGAFCSNYSNNHNKIVVDGDGLNILSKQENWWKNLQGEIILTPHPGEMARLTGLTIKEIQSNRINITKEYAGKWGQTVVLKGANTVIAFHTGKFLLSPFADPVLATAGTGDVLSGIIAGMLAQGLPPFEAAGVSVCLHELAGERLSKEIGQAGVLASDILPILPQVIKKLI